MPASGTDLRLNRFLARAGLGSRRTVEALILAGRVRINGQTVQDLGRRVDPGADLVTLDGVALRLAADFRVYAFHKPLDVVCTLKGQGGQPTLEPYRRRADLPERFVPVGRLDSDSTGLLLWTDDGDLNQRLCRPRSGVWKAYRVDLSGPLPADQAAALAAGGMVLDGRPCLPCRLDARTPSPCRHWLVHLHEGRRRQIRRMFQALGITVTALHRVSFGPVPLGRLKPGDFRRLTAREVAELRRVVATPDRFQPDQGVR